jgi:hypothetical protein
MPVTVVRLHRFFSFVAMGDEMEARVMFGDPFGNRGDYSKGIFYGGRRSVISFTL